MMKQTLDKEESQREKAKVVAITNNWHVMDTWHRRCWSFLRQQQQQQCA